MMPDQQSATVGKYLTCSHSHEALANQSNKPSYIEKLASRVCSLPCFVRLREERRRKKRAIRSRGKDESDFTEESPRIISVSDDVNDDYAALLLTKSFSSSIKTAIQVQRDLFDAICTVERYNEATLEFQWRINEKVDHYLRRREDLAIRIEGADTEQAVALEKEAQEVERKVEKLELLVKRETWQQQDRQIALHLRYKNFFEVQGVANRFIEAAFINAGYLSPPEQKQHAPNPRKSISEEFRKLDDDMSETRREPGPVQQHYMEVSAANRAARQAVHQAAYRAAHQAARRDDSGQSTHEEPLQIAMESGTANVAANGRPLHHGEDPGQSRPPHQIACRLVPGQHDHKELLRAATESGAVDALNGGFQSHHDADTTKLRSPSPVLFAPVHLHGQYWQAKLRLASAQREFDLRHDDRERECDSNQKMLQDSGGVRGMPQELLDLQWVEYISELTRELIEAEEAFKQAKIAAVEGGFDIGDSDMSSLFDDQRSDGYTPSFEAAVKATAPKELIEGWCQSVPAILDGAEIEVPESDLDLWEEDQSDFWDSSSAVVDPRHHAKIQEWQKVCAATGKKPAI